MKPLDISNGGNTVRDGISALESMKPLDILIGGNTVPDGISTLVSIKTTGYFYKIPLLEMACQHL